MRIVATWALGAMCLLSASPAFGQATRTWVSGVGDDANPCSRTAPCKTFAGAISKTAAGGEINIIDSGGFGSVTITKSITIDGNGALGSILASNANGIIVNGAGIVVNLRNITINGASTTTGNGIRIVNAAAVNIDNVTIENIGGTGTNGKGITIETSGSNVRVSVQNSRLANINQIGVESAPTGGNVLLSLDNVSFVRGSGSAMVIRQNTAASINDTRVSGQVAGSAVTILPTGSSAHISNSAFMNNAYGIFAGDAGGAPMVWLYHTVISGSTVSALTINSGQVVSHGNNAIRGNAGNENPSSNVGTQ